MVFYHGTSKEAWKDIQNEGILFGRRYVLNNDGSIHHELDRCTYLAINKEEAKQYGDIILEVNYNPYDEKGNIKTNKKGLPLNNYIPNGWQLRVYEPISINNIKVL